MVLLIYTNLVLITLTQDLCTVLEYTCQEITLDQRSLILEESYHQTITEQVSNKKDSMFYFIFKF